MHCKTEMYRSQVPNASHRDKMKLRQLQFRLKKLRAGIGLRGAGKAPFRFVPTRGGYSHVLGEEVTIERDMQDLKDAEQQRFVCIGLQ